MQRDTALRAPRAAGALPDDHALLAELNENYVRSVAASDVAWFERHLAPDFLNSNPDGSLVDRAGFLRQIGRPVTVTGLRCEDVRIRILGDTAIVHARTVYKKPDGTPAAAATPISGCARPTGVGSASPRM